MKDDGGPAFPYEDISKVALNGARSEWHVYPGMTLRDKFADSAISLFPLADDDVRALVSGAMRPRHDIVAKFCYDLADAMLEERKK